MAQATAHPDRRLISSEDVVGTDVYGRGDEVVGEIDHLLIEKVSGRVAYAVMSFGGFLGLAHSHYPLVSAQIRHRSRWLSHGNYRRAAERCPGVQRRFLDRPKLGNPYSSAYGASPYWGA